MYEFVKVNFRWLAGGFLLTYFSSFGQTFFVSASVAEWRAAFDLSHGEFGRIYMMATLASAICLPFIGRIVDVIPEHRTILIVVPILAIASLLAAAAPSVIVLILAIFLLRLFGQGMMTHIALTATGRWFDEQRGRAVSLVVLGHQGGEATLPLIFAAIATASSYRIGWVAGALSLLFIGLPLTFLAYRQPRDLSHQESTSKARSLAIRHWTRGEVLRDAVFWILLIGVLAPPFIGTTIFFHQDYLTEFYNWPDNLFAKSLTVMAITTIAFALLCGVLIDRFRSSRVLPIILLPLAATCFVLANAQADQTLYLVMILLGISYGCSSTLLGAIWPEVYGTMHLGAIRSVIVSAMVLATAAGPGITGTLIDRGISLPVQLEWAAAYCMFATLTLIAACWQLQRRQRLADR